MMQSKILRTLLLLLLVTLTVTASPQFIGAAEPSSAAASSSNIAQQTSDQPDGLQWLDWILITLYACSTLGLGWYYSRRQRTTEEYFVGSGNMNPILIGVSLFATLLSTISYLSMPGEASGKGPVSVVSMLGLPITYALVAYFLLPIYMKQRVTSAYELLEERLGLSIRLLGATMFLILRLIWMSLLVFLAAKAMTVMMGLDEKWILPIVAITGFVSVVYTSLGGLQAVVITDLMQTLLLFGGALLVLATVTYDFGGFGWFPTVWQETWDTQPIFPDSIKTRVSLVGAVITGVTWFVCTSGGDQTSVQRFMATRDVQAARNALKTQLAVTAIVGITLALVGFALLGYFQKHVDLLPSGMTIAKNADDLFPHYISYHLPMGVSGLVVAAMFAAAMSSIDSGVNSITAVVMTDYLDRFGLRPKTEKGHVRSAQVLAFAIGAIAVFGSLYVGKVQGNISAITSKTTNLLVTPIFSLFFFAIFVPYARPIGVWIGTVCGILTALVTAFSGPIVAWLAEEYKVDPALFGTEWTKLPDKTTGKLVDVITDPISFQWIGPIALAVNIAVGSAVSLMVRKKPQKPN